MAENCHMFHLTIYSGLNYVVKRH